MRLKHRYWLYQREDGCYYLEDTQTRKRESLRTKDAVEAERLRDARNQSVEQPALNLALAKTYLSAIDPNLAGRTWAVVIEEFCNRGKESTRARNQRAIARKNFDLLRHKKLVETTADDFRTILKTMGAFNNHILRCLHNLALGLGWLHWPIIPPKLWPQPKEKEKRGITREEHAKVLQSEQDRERRLYYELLWETGASQSDAALMRAENIDWNKRELFYLRSKTGEPARLVIGLRMEAILRQLPATGPLFCRQSALSSSDRAAEFSRRCRVVGIKGVSLHSYRYAWAQRTLESAYPERYAQEALGHASKAVHRMYAKSRNVKIPPLEDYENRPGSGNVIPLRFEQPCDPAPTSQASSVALVKGHSKYGVAFDHFWLTSLILLFLNVCLSIIPRLGLHFREP
ncbi:tyrosine-type recombinase/integrase [Pedosphaera parvula]|uniref:Integrase family protein n=1 Tax=Pedosphaera parvula (strain Ellin514) TaxID=320771 RepID=B9XRD0_PEDPL|nr:tyrosine-type recombinase/integrase [Pedosphaera parvula]EEF57617.1 integrase family protein [Pedosphaera parvula Ellin514]